ncbi:MAG: hypothetical protein AB7G06_04275 [Bdellovibrionales bacterium]
MMKNKMPVSGAVLLSAILSFPLPAHASPSDDPHPPLCDKGVYQSTQSSSSIASPPMAVPQGTQRNAQDNPSFQMGTQYNSQRRSQAPQIIDPFEVIDNARRGRP